jgi:hypothetical protein
VGGIAYAYSSLNCAAFAGNGGGGGNGGTRGAGSEWRDLNRDHWFPVWDKYGWVDHFLIPVYMRSGAPGIHGDGGAAGTASALSTYGSSYSFTYSGQAGYDGVDGN